MTRPSRSNRRDANEAALVELWRGLGCVWIPMQPGQGFDGLLIARNGVHIVEIKRPNFRRFTQDEAELLTFCLNRSQKYNVITTEEQARRLIER